MTRQVIREGTICPDCDNGFVPDGECVACAGTGWIGREVVHVRDGWLYLPDQLLWINGASIETINGWHAEDDPSCIVSYTVHLYSQEPNEYIEAESQDDIAAVRTWLEGRS